MGKTLNKTDWLEKTKKEILGGTYGTTQGQRDWVTSTASAIKEGTYSTKNTMSNVKTNDEKYRQALVDNAYLKMGHPEETSAYKSAFSKYADLAQKDPRRFGELRRAMQERQQNEEYQYSLEDLALETINDNFTYYATPEALKYVADTGSVIKNLARGAWSPVDAAGKLISKATTGKEWSFNDTFFGQEGDSIDQSKHRTRAMQVADTVASGLGSTLSMMAGGTLAGSGARALGATDKAAKIAANFGMGATIFPVTLEEELNSGKSTDRAIISAITKTAASVVIENMGGFKLAEGDITLQGLNTLVEEASEEMIESVFDTVLDKADNIINEGGQVTADDFVTLLVEAFQSAALSVPITLILGGARGIASDVKNKKTINKVAKATGMKKSDVKQQLTNAYTQNQQTAAEVQQKAEEKAKEIDTKYGEIDEAKETERSEKILEKQAQKDEIKEQKRAEKEALKEQKAIEKKQQEEFQQEMTIKEDDTDTVKNLKNEIVRVNEKLNTIEDTETKEMYQNKLDTLYNDYKTEIMKTEDQKEAINALMKVGMSKKKATSIVMGNDTNTKKTSNEGKEVKDNKPKKTKDETKNKSTDIDDNLRNNKHGTGKETRKGVVIYKDSDGNYTSNNTGTPVELKEGQKVATITVSDNNKNQSLYDMIVDQHLLSDYMVQKIENLTDNETELLELALAALKNPSNSNVKLLYVKDGSTNKIVVLNDSAINNIDADSNTIPDFKTLEEKYKTIKDKQDAELKRQQQEELNKKQQEQKKKDDEYKKILNAKKTQEKIQEKVFKQQDKNTIKALNKNKKVSTSKENIKNSKIDAEQWSKQLRTTYNSIDDKLTKMSKKADKIALLDSFITSYNNYLNAGYNEIDGIDLSTLENKKAELIGQKTQKTNETKNDYKLNDIYSFMSQEFQSYLQSGLEGDKGKALGWYSQYRQKGGKKTSEITKRLDEIMTSTQEQAVQVARDDFKAKLSAMIDITNSGFKDTLNAKKSMNYETELFYHRKGVHEGTAKKGIPDYNRYAMSKDVQYELSNGQHIIYKANGTFDTKNPKNAYLVTDEEYNEAKGNIFMEKTIMDAIDTNFPNTSEAHAFVMAAARLSAKVQLPVRFVDNIGAAKSNLTSAELREKTDTELNKIGSQVLGGFDFDLNTKRPKGIIINVEATPAQMRLQVLGHEFYHFLRFNNIKNIDNTILKYAKEYYDTKISELDIANRYDEDTMKIPEYKDTFKTLANARKEELLCEYMGMIFTDHNELVNLASKEPSVIGNIKSFLRQMYYRVTNQHEKAFIETLSRKLQNAINEVSIKRNAPGGSTGINSYLYDKTGTFLDKVDIKDFDTVVNEEETAIDKTYKNNKLDKIIIALNNKLYPLQKLDKINSRKNGVETTAIMDAYDMYESAYSQGQAAINSYQSDLNGKYIGNSIETILAPIEKLSTDKYNLVSRIWRLQSELSRIESGKLNDKEYKREYFDYSENQIKALLKDYKKRYPDLYELTEQTNKNMQMFNYNQNKMKIETGILPEYAYVTPEFASEKLNLTQEYMEDNTTNDGYIKVKNIDFLSNFDTYYIHDERFIESSAQPNELTNTPKYNLGVNKVKGITDNGKNYALYDLGIGIRQGVMDDWHRIRQQQLFSLIGDSFQGKQTQVFDKKGDNALEQLQKEHDGLMTDHEGRTYIGYYIDGKYYKKQVASCIQDVFTPYSNQVTEWLDNTVTGQKLTNVLKRNSEILREAYTGINSGGYFIKNKIMDVQDYVYSTDSKLQDVIRNSNSYISDKNNNAETYNIFKSLGLDSQFKGYDTSNKALNKKSNNKFKNMLDAMEEFNAHVEASTRYTAFKTVYEETGDTKKAIAAAKESTTNFSKTGSLFNALDRHGITIYFGSSMAGLNKAIETNIIRITDGVSAAVNGIKNKSLTEYDKTCIKRMVRQLSKMAAYGVTESLLRKLLSLFDDDDTYNLLPSYVKDNSYIIPIGTGNYISIPRGRMLSIPYSLNNLFASDISDVDKKSIAEAVNYIWERVGVNDFGNSLSVSTFKQLIENKTSFGYQIVDDDMSLDEKTKTRLKYVFDAYGGVIADIVDMGIDYKDGKTIKIPVLKTYYGDANSNTNAQARYWEYINKYTSSKDLLDRLTYQSLSYDYNNQIAPLKKQLDLYIKSGDNEAVREIRQEINNLYTQLISNVDDEKIDVNGDGTLISYRGYLYELEEDEYGVQKYHKKRD